MTRLVMCIILVKCDFDHIFAYFVKIVNGRRRVPKIAIFVFLGAPSCHLFGHVLKKFMNFI